MDNYYEILNIEQYSDIDIVINSYNNIIKNYNKKKLSLEEKIFIKNLPKIILLKELGLLMK